MDEDEGQDSVVADSANVSMIQTSLKVDFEKGVAKNMTKAVIFKNLIIVSFAFMLLFSAFNSFVYLQSSLNKDEGLGTSGLALLYISMVLSGLFVAPISFSRLSDKAIIVISMFTYIVYMATGFYPAWSTIIPASVVIGTGAAHLWLALQTYITDIATAYAIITHTKTQDRLHLFLGIFYAFTYSSNVWGNIVSSYVFQHTSPNKNTSESLKDVCGPNFCPFKEMNNSAISQPTNRQIYTFTGVCAGISTLAVLLTLVFVTNISSEAKTIDSLSRKLRLVTKQIFTSRNQILLLSASLFGGLSYGFTAGDFTSAYITCPYGIESVGFVMITFGVFQSLSSVVLGKLYQYCGHIPIYTFGFVTQLAAYITLLLLNPKESEYVIMYVVSALFGVGAGINTPLVSALHNLYFDKDREIAVSSFRVLQSLGGAIAFAYSNWLCTQYKIYILISVLTIALVTLTLLHFIHKKEAKTSRC